MTFTAYFAAGLGDPLPIERAEDVDGVVDRLIALDDNRRIATLVWTGGEFDSAQLVIGIDRERDVGIVEYYGYDSFISQGDSREPGEIWYSDGWDSAHNVPNSAEVPSQTVKAAVREFYDAQGALPTGVLWSDDAP